MTGTAAWLSRVECFFRSITVDRLRNGVFHRGADLKQAISSYINAYNKRPKPFVCTAKVSDILQKLIRARMTKVFCVTGEICG